MERLLRPLLCAAALVLPLAARAPRADEALTPAEIINRAQSQLQVLDDYQCVAECNTRLGERTDGGACRIWYKSPGLLRVKGTRGRNRGAEVVLGKNGKLYGRKGGLLKPFVSRLKPTDSRVCNLRGTPVTALCWVSICKRLRERLDLPGTRATLGAPYEVTVTYPDGARTVQERCRFDPAHWFPVEARILEDGEEVERVEFREIKLNTGLSADWFRL